MQTDRDRYAIEKLHFAGRIITQRQGDHYRGSPGYLCGHQLLRLGTL